MLATNWKETAEKVARQYPEDDTTDLTNYILDEVYVTEPEGAPDRAMLDLAYHTVRQWLIEVMACNPDT